MDKGKVLFFVGLSLIIVSGFLFYNTFFPIMTTENKLIESFPDSEKRFYDEGKYLVTERGIKNTKREGVIFPNDELEYSFQVHNLKDFKTKIEYKLEIYKNELRYEPVYFGHSELSPNTIKTKTIEGIYLNSTGSYDFLLNINFKNSTGVSYGNYSSGWDDVETITRSEQEQIKQNNNFLLGVIVSGIIGGLTILALFFSVIYSKKEVEKLTEQNNNLKEQFDIQNKPWILVNQIEPKFATYGTRDIPWEEYLKNLARDPETEIPDHMKMYASCTNVGKSSAKIIEYRYSGDTITTFEKLKQNKHSERIIFPNQSVSFAPTIVWDTNKDFFVAYLIEYTYSIFDKKETVFVGTQWKIRDKGIFNLEHWPKEL